MNISVGETGILHVFFAAATAEKPVRLKRNDLASGLLTPFCSEAPTKTQFQPEREKLSEEWEVDQPTIPWKRFRKLARDGWGTLPFLRKRMGI